MVGRLTNEWESNKVKALKCIMKERYEIFPDFIAFVYLFCVPGCFVNYSFCYDLIAYEMDKCVGDGYLSWDGFIYWMTDDDECFPVFLFYSISSQVKVFWIEIILYFTHVLFLF
ncbi:hypothetical protein EYC80_007064 [Monilinia laxa]|uniref:Uncharacterized protein n=1 Tax=Monilinia laxa TaxID=61186 RepID=A0A5N6K017_MONLA|nr:hypothetical protein EYC80_007064 [Monilinia laxa]